MRLEGRLGVGSLLVVVVGVGVVVGGIVVVAVAAVGVGAAAVREEGGCERVGGEA